MTGREKRWLICGILAGIVITVSISSFFYRDLSAVSTEGAASGTSKDGVSPVIDSRGPDAEVLLTAAEQSRIGIQTLKVQRESLFSEIVLPGWVQEVDGMAHSISSRLAGRIDRSYLSIPGQMVKKGQIVAMIDSPEIISAVRDYRTAVNARNEQSITASARRLESLGIPSNRLQDLLALPDDQIRAPVYSDLEGVLRSQNLVEGRFVGAGEPLFVLTNLETVWVRASVFQSDLGQLRTGMEVEITSEAIPGEVFHGTLSAVELQSDQQTLTTPVRVEVRNTGMRLRPGIFVRCAFKAVVGKNVLAVPRSAVLDTGSGKVVYVATVDSLFHRRRIQVGPATKDHYPVLNGLVEGERVVTNGAFLLDSQARLNSGAFETLGNAVSPTQTQSQPAEDNEYRIALKISPDPVPVGRQSNARVTILDRAGRFVDDAEVRMQAVMPAMPSMGMPEMRSTADMTLAGSEYVGTVHIGMAGLWNVAVEARRGTQLIAKYETRVNAR